VPAGGAASAPPPVRVEPTLLYVILHGSLCVGDGQMARIVIVEDETTVLMLAESVLQQAGHETVSAATVAEAQAIVHSDEKFDLVFTDVQLGNHKEGGLTIGKVLAEARKGTPVLYASGRELTDGMQALFVEPSAFLPKPYTVQQLTEAVAELLRVG
jgi:two-component system, cell cycle sensor histidine kinase and response regulator CckA